MIDPPQEPVIALSGAGFSPNQQANRGEPVASKKPVKKVVKAKPVAAKKSTSKSKPKPAAAKKATTKKATTAKKKPVAKKAATKKAAKKATPKKAVAKKPAPKKPAPKKTVTKSAVTVTKTVSAVRPAKSTTKPVIQLIANVTKTATSIPVQSTKRSRG